MIRIDRVRLSWITDRHNARSGYSNEEQEQEKERRSELSVMY